MANIIFAKKKVNLYIKGVNEKSYNSFGLFNFHGFAGNFFFFWLCECVKL